MLGKHLLEFDREHEGDPLLVIVLDEASSLLSMDGSDKTQPGLYVAYNRIISCLRKEPIWFFILSTESKLEELLPPTNARRGGDFVNDPSARFATTGRKSLDPFPPFLALQLDIQDRERIQSPTQRDIELRKPMSMFSDFKHIAMFGRPLWCAYDDEWEMISVAMLKLVGGKQG
jgi:hypothetical protein